MDVSSLGRNSGDAPQGAGQPTRSSLGDAVTDTAQLGPGFTATYLNEATADAMRPGLGIYKTDTILPGPVAAKDTTTGCRVMNRYDVASFGRHDGLTEPCSWNIVVPTNQSGEGGRETTLTRASRDTIRRRRARDFDVRRCSAGDLDELRCCDRELDVSPGSGCTGGYQRTSLACWVF